MVDHWSDDRYWTEASGLVFMLLVNMLRDIKAGVQAAFAPADVCELLLGGYSGQSREQLRQVILRLQQGVLEFPRFAVRLAQRFEFPDDGPWRVALDPDIVELFSWSRQTWLELKTSLSLPVGLATSLGCMGTSRASPCSFLFASMRYVRYAARMRLLTHLRGSYAVRCISWWQQMCLTQAGLSHRAPCAG